MSFRIDNDRVNELADSSPSNPIMEVVDAARRAYCSLYNNHPTWVLAKNTLTIPIVTRTLNHVCRDLPTPTPPTDAPFTGGQCAGVQYTMVLSALSQSVFGGDPVERTINAITVTGVVLGVDYDDSQAVQNVAFSCEHSDGAANTPYTWNLSSNQRLVPGTVSVAFETADGSPDTCGDPPASGYPPEPPPTTTDVTTNVDITNVAGDVTTYNTVVNFDPSGTIVFPPRINVEGVEVTIDVGGVTIDDSRDRPSGGSPRSEDPIVAEEEEEEEETETEIIIVGATISSEGNLDTFNSTAGNGAPDVYYIGWCEFQFEGVNYPRQFIHFLESRFDAPEQVDNFVVTFRPGWTGSVTILTEEVQVPVA